MSRPQTFAPAKVNLTLRVLARRPDGYHGIASLAAFAAVGDELALEPGIALDLETIGPMAKATGPKERNLVVRAAQALAARVDGLRLGRFVLDKRLPAGAGLGGGSADAAAALRLLAQSNGISTTDRRVLDAALAVGADVPVCIDALPRLMHGRGEELSAPVELPQIDVVLVFPAIGIATADVFGRYTPKSVRGVRYSTSDIPSTRDELLSFLLREGNDLESTAVSIVPAVAEARASLERSGGPRVVRMTGSGSTMFGIYDDAKSATVAAAEIRSRRPDWWVIATTLN
jgi:4-diphosphocytidyl-2-C-methyl-D-erythritol kinase